MRKGLIAYLAELRRLFDICGSPPAGLPPSSPHFQLTRQALHQQALIEQVLRHLPQPASQDRRTRSGKAWTYPTPPAGPEVWEKVIRKVRGGMMPPVGMPRPDKAALDGSRVVSRDRRSTRLQPLRPNPGRTVLHRLNRAEYGNALRDFLALDVDVTSLLPPDDSSVRLRQHRRRARRLAGADGAIPVGRMEDQQPRRGQSEDHADDRNRSAFDRRSVAGRSHRRPADRDTRRNPDSLQLSRSTAST